MIFKREGKGITFRADIRRIAIKEGARRIITVDDVGEVEVFYCNTVKTLPCGGDDVQGVSMVELGLSGETITEGGPCTFAPKHDLISSKNLAAF